MGLNMWPADAVTGAPAYTGRMLRQLTNAVWAGKTAARPLGARSGVVQGTPSSTVTVAGSTWTVQPHIGVLDVEAAAAAGAYTYSLDSAQTGAVTAADLTNPRIDLISVQISDPAEGDGSTNPVPAIIYTTGAPASSPSVPATPARSSPIAKIRVEASGGPASSVTWIAPNVTAVGGITVCADATFRPASPHVGQHIDDPTFGLMRWNGTIWQPGRLRGSGSLAFSAGVATDTQAVPFTFTFDTAPDVFVQHTGTENFHLAVNSITTTGFTLRASLGTGANAAVGHSVPFLWRAFAR